MRSIKQSEKLIVKKINNTRFQYDQQYKMVPDFRTPYIFISQFNLFINTIHIFIAIQSFGLIVKYCLTLRWPMATKVPLIKFAKCTPNQVS